MRYCWVFVPCDLSSWDGSWCFRISRVPKIGFWETDKFISSMYIKTIKNLCCVNPVFPRSRRCVCFLTKKKKENGEGRAGARLRGMEVNLGMRLGSPPFPLVNGEKKLSMSKWDMISFMEPALNPHRRWTGTMQDHLQRVFFGGGEGGKRGLNEHTHPTPTPTPIFRCALETQQQVQRLLGLQLWSFSRADFLIALPTTCMILY